MRQALRREERAQALVWAAVMLPLFLAVVGLAIDGGMLFNARRSLQNVADSAARVGAMQLDERTLRGSGTVALEPERARQAAADYLAAQRAGVVAGTVAADPRQVVVQVHRQVPTGFIRLAGVETVSIGATATARPCSGIEQGTC